MDLVVMGPVRRGIPQNHQRPELFKRFQRLRALHLLRFVQNQNGTVGADDINGATRLEVVQFLVNPAVLLPGGVERLNVDDHHIDARVRGKALKMRQVRGIIDEKPGFLPVALGKVSGRDVQRLEHSLANGDAGRHNDELRPAVPLVHLEDGLDVAVRLPRAGFHLHVEVDAAPGAGRQGFRKRQIPSHLDGTDVFEQSLPSQLNIGVPKALDLRIRYLFFSRLYTYHSGIDAVCRAGSVDLSGEAVDHGFDGSGLEGLDFEFELHADRPPHRPGEGSKASYDAG